ncbi:peptidase family M13 [Gonapodya prolifera JEL478]|uniref:Peptidase family M13 n=1 Tax=Gonapodya prolifera (strain JEL478) TaxID=1344416 RepID=A0A139ATD1_GONPJ|nr:peptidase family M13 [Gonapodya prolifera JEL478]|eukprot:KXS19982.1 peptidase family M13 [Gonapodya prolifera JEL478]
MAAPDDRQPLLDRQDADEERGPAHGVPVWARLERFSRTEKMLGPASFLLLVLVLVFGSLYVSSSPGRRGRGPPGDMCLTPECVVGAAAIVNNLNTKVSPCEDFYEFACGGWTEKNPIPDAKSRISSFDVLSDNNKRVLRAALESPYRLSSSVPAGQEAQDRANFDMVAGLYKTCTNETAIDAVGAKPVLDLLTKLDAQVGDLADATAYAHQIGVPVLFGIGVEADFVDPDSNKVYVGQDGISLPSPEYYQEPKTVAFLKQVITDTFAVIVKDVPKGYADWAAVADRIVAFETKLAAITLPADELQDPAATYNPTKISTLVSTTPSFPWTEYLNLRFPSAQFPDLVKPDTEIIVTTPKYFADLEAVLKAVDLKDLKLYFHWHLIDGYAGALGEQWREPHKRFRQFLSGAKADPPRWEVCLGVVDNILGYMEGKLFVDAAFSGDSKEAASRTIDGIKAAMIRRIPELTWIDPATQEEAIAKVKALTRKIGFPDFTLDPTKLREKYDGLEIDPTSYFQNILQSSEWQESDNLKKINKPVDRSEWDMSPQTVNAYYNPPGNEIEFPAGILQSPFFTAALPSYLNYGGIGAVVGHELTHAFDNNGREFDKEGKLRDWWGEETSRNFEERAQCFVNQYGNFTVKGPDGKSVNVNGKLTLGENLADVGGISRAFEAWKTEAATPEGSKQNFLLPGLQAFSKEQLFFVSFAQVWCSAVRPAQAVQRVRTDPHSPPVYRVLGAIKDTKEFKTAFGCSGKYPTCQIW